MCVWNGFYFYERRSEIVNDCLDLKDICARENLSYILIVDVTFCIVWIRDR
jgi:hypothetical protein